MRISILCWWLSIFVVITSPAIAQQEGGDSSGTDPRGFSSKFMPYYSHVELNNGVEVDQVNLFGMYAFNSKMAMTYDLPVYKDIEGPLGQSESGIGDLGLRIFYKPDATQFEKSSHMFGAELILPTATSTNTFIGNSTVPFSVLGDDTVIASPMYIYVRDIKLLSPGFFALMNFYDFDIEKGTDGKEVNRYRGRWFLMQPLSRPGPGLLDGIYLLPEFQPVYDFEKDDNEFSLWAAPELGKMLSWGAAYIKPGFGIVNDDATDRDWTLELGFRYFFK